MRSASRSRSSPGRGGTSRSARRAWRATGPSRRRSGTPRASRSECSARGSPRGRRSTSPPSVRSTAGSSPGSRPPSLKVNASLESYRFDEAANALYAFFWSEFCDGYVEMVKPALRGEGVPEAEKAKTRAVLRRVLLDSLAMLHPFMPFVSCEIREALNGDGMTLPVARFPQADPAWDDPLAVSAVETIRAAATRIRNLRAERGLAQTEPLAAGLEVAAGPLADELARHRSLLVHLARLASLDVSPKVDLPGAFHDAIGAVGPRRLAPGEGAGRRGAGEAREGAGADRPRRRGGEEAARRRRVPLAGAGGGRREEPEAARGAGGEARAAGREPRPGWPALREAGGDGCVAALAPRLAGTLRRPPLLVPFEPADVRGASVDERPRQGAGRADARRRHRASTDRDHREEADAAARPFGPGVDRPRRRRAQPVAPPPVARRAGADPPPHHGSASSSRRGSRRASAST